MCGRYLFEDLTAYEIERELGLMPGFFSRMPRGDINPGMMTGALTMTHKQLTLEEMLWGIEGIQGKPIINARSETALEKMMFRESLLKRRCILPASAFYEWDAQKQKVTFFHNDHRPIYLAGFFLPDAARKRFVVLTTGANASMEKVHDRMPLMMEKDEVRDWLYRDDLVETMLRKKMPQMENDRRFEQLTLL